MRHAETSEWEQGLRRAAVAKNTPLDDLRVALMIPYARHLYQRGILSRDDACSVTVTCIDEIEHSQIELSDWERMALIAASTTKRRAKLASAYENPPEEIIARIKKTRWLRDLRKDCRGVEDHEIASIIARFMIERLMGSDEHSILTRIEAKSSGRTERCLDVCLKSAWWYGDKFVSEDALLESP